MLKLFNVFAIVLITLGCQKEISNETQLSAPIITTSPVTAINRNSALSGGIITSDGGDSIIQRGVCWDTLHNPIRTNSHTSDGVGIGTFVSSLTGLLPTTTYYIRAYAVNSVGTAYGNEFSFTTSISIVNLPTLTTTPINELFSTTAKSGGTITADGGAAVIVRGVCWSTTANPTIALSTKTSDGTGIGTFTSAITGLTASTTYHVRAYATNSVGTAYGNDVSFITSSSTPDVYVAGYEFNSTGTAAIIWKNGLRTSLTNGFEAHGNCVFVSATDVYVAGFQFNGSNNIPKIWKNNVASSLPSGTCGGELNSVFVSGTDVYAVGSTSNCSDVRATIWKNGVSTTLTNGSISAKAESVFVLGSDVYVAGWENTGSNTFAKGWKNGVQTILSMPGNEGLAHSVVVSGTDLYVGGEETTPSAPNIYIAKIWKNGVPVNITDGTYDASIKSIFISGADVYAAGYEIINSIQVAKVWKNGVPTSLTNGTIDATAESVFVFGTDVYVAGYESPAGQFNPKIWKNGVATSLITAGFGGYAFSVFLK